MIAGKFIGGDEDLSEIFSIRRKIFCDELGEPEEQVFDGKDKLAMHVIVYDNNNVPAAAGRAIFENDKFKIGFIGVLKEQRGKFYGDFIVRMLCNKAIYSGAKEIYLDARKNAVDFYKRIGFSVCGETCPKTGFIPMVLYTGNFTSRCGSK